MTSQLMESINYESSYLQLFQRAQENLQIVCSEYKKSPLCKKTRRWKGKHFKIETLIH